MAAGVIKLIENASFYFTKEIIIYGGMKVDTVHFSGYHFALSDVYAVPKKGVRVDYIKGAYRVNLFSGDMFIGIG